MIFFIKKVGSRWEPVPPGDAGAPAAGVAGAEGAVEVPVEAPVEAKARRAGAPRHVRCLS
jgi:hypothetical protein